jgi:hypothetical protein
MIAQDGTFLGLSGDTLRVQVGDRAEVIPVPAVVRFELNTRPGGGHKLVGFIGGALVGAVIGYTAFRRSAPICDNQCDLRPLNASLFGLVCGLGGIVAGAVLPPAQWEHVDLRAAQSR